MAALAAAEVSSLFSDERKPSDSPDNSRLALAESAVVGMVLHERVLIALHRLAQEDASSRYFG
jgi:hypothetical protein